MLLFVLVIKNWFFEMSNYEICNLIISSLLLLVGASYSYVTYKIFKQGKNTIEKMSEQIEIQKRNFSYKIIPYLSIQNNPPSHTSKHPRFNNITIINKTNNPAFFIVILWIKSRIINNQEVNKTVISYKYVIPCLVFNEQIITCDEMQVQSKGIIKILQLYDYEQFMPYITNPSFLIKRDGFHYNYIIILYKDIEGTTHMTQKSIPYIIDQNGNSLVGPAEIGYEEFFQHVTIETLLNRINI
ncbi:MAG: hypothetical protein LBW85_07260 [Deltaproteobacteria bacterium]|jgi:hypothetical protein|nr:hypothetical protein [Deltaproteobacteria bacterium]